MTEGKGPWDPGPDEPPSQTPAKPHRPFQFGLWLALMAAVGVGILALNRMFPGAIASSQDQAGLAYTLGLVAVISAGLLRVRQVNLGRTARHLAIWVGVVALLAVGYSYRRELGAIATRVRSDVVPGGVSAAPRQMLVSQNDQGAFVVIGQVNGQTVRFAVDTGSSDIVLSPSDARRLGVDVDGLTFGEVTETANGSGRTAPFLARSLVVGDLRLNNVRMDINSRPMTTSLLGMSFLNRLDSYQVSDGRLYLKWRG